MSTTESLKLSSVNIEVTSTTLPGNYQLHNNTLLSQLLL